MLKARRPDFAFHLSSFVAAAAVLALSTWGACARAAPALAPWEQALAGCAPGSAFTACVAALKAAGVKVKESTDRAAFNLDDPYGDVSIETDNPGAKGRIVTVALHVSLARGAPRKAFVEGVKGAVDMKLAKKVDSEDQNAALHCGAGMWGVGFRNARVESPEVQVQLSQPDDDNDDDWKDRLARLKPEDRVITKGENAEVIACFLWARPARGFTPMPADPVLSPAALRAFVESAAFHGKARLPGSASPPALEKPGKSPPPSAGGGGASLSPEATRAFFDAYRVDEKDRAAWLASANKASADLNGDGAPEYLVEISREGGSDGQTACESLLLVNEAGAYRYADNVLCCDYVMKAAAAGKGGRIDCRDPDDKKPAFVWKGAWPKGENKHFTQSEVKANFEKGLALYKQNRAEEARPLMCSFQRGIGQSDEPEFVNACATVLIKLKRLDEARQMLDKAASDHPDYRTFYANIGTIAEQEKNTAKAIDAYQKYLASAPAGPSRSMIEKRVAELKKSGAK